MELITSTEILSKKCTQFAQSDFITVDTEFLRRDTFWPKLCLIQMASANDAVMIDALSPNLNLTSFFELMREQSVLKVFHSAWQDLEIIAKMSDSLPTPIFDTQIVARVCGYGDSISYYKLVADITGVQLDKTSQDTDWSVRPLSQKQLDYAIADVTHLRDVYSYLSLELQNRNRMTWIEEEIQNLAEINNFLVPPECAWKRLNLRRIKNSVELGILQEIATWREHKAHTKNLPRPRVLKDEAIYEIVSKRPTDTEALAKLKFIPKNFAKVQAGKEIVTIVEKVLRLPATMLPQLPKQQHPSKDSTNLIDLFKILLKSISMQNDVAPRIIASTTDLQRIAMDDHANVPALKGWRRELFGEIALKVKHGELAVTVNNNNIQTIPTNVTNLLK